MRKEKEGRTPLGRAGLRSGDGVGSAKEDREVQMAGLTVSLTRCDSASSMASAGTTESTTASIAGRKRQNEGGDSSSSSSDILKMERPKKAKGKKLPQAPERLDAEGGSHNIRDPTGKFSINPRETRRNLAKLESLREAEDAALDRRVQLPTKRQHKSRALEQRMLDEMFEHPTEGISSIVGVEAELVEKLAYGANNLSGTTQKALYEAAAKFKAAATILQQRLQTAPGGDALEELRGEMEALKRENVELKAGLTSAKAEIKKLKERSTVTIRDSPARNRTATRRINSDTDSDEAAMQVELSTEGETTGREGGAVFPRPRPPPDAGLMAPVFRPPLKGVATRNLDDGSLEMPPRERTSRDGTAGAPDIRTIIVSVLREMGLAGRGAVSQRVEETLTTRDPKTRGKKSRKGKGEVKVGRAGRFPISLPTPGSGMPPPTSAVTAHRKGDQGQGPNEQPRPNPGSLQTGTTARAQQDTWAKVVGRRGRRGTALQAREPQGSEGAPPGLKKSAQNSGPAGRTGTGARVVKLGNAPRTPAVTITAPPGQYGDILREARAGIDLAPLGIAELRPRRAITGAMILEIPGDKEGSKADALAGKLTELFANREAIKVSRPYKKAELRIRDLDDSVNPTEIIEALAKEGKCGTEQVKLGDIKWSPNRIGTAWVQCPLAAAKLVTAQKRLRVGWMAYRVDALPPRRLQCYRCLELGHTSAKCGSAEDRSRCCYRCGQEGHRSNTCTLPLECPVCKKAGKKAEHKVGTGVCGALPKKNKGGRRMEKGNDPQPTAVPIVAATGQPLPPSGTEQELPSEKRAPRDTQGTLTPMEVCQEEAAEQPPTQRPRE